MIKKLGIGCATFVIVAVVAAVAAVYFYGPIYGPRVVGKPVFLGQPSPTQYVESVLRMADEQAIYRDSGDYPPARRAALDAAEHAESYDDIYGPLDAALQAAGGKHSGISSPEDLAGHAQDSPAQMPTVDIDGGVAVATVPAVSAFDGDGQEYADILAHGLNDALNTGACAAIVDLRDNTGGDMGPMLAGLSPLLADGTAMEFYGGEGNISPVTVSGGAVTGGGSPITVDGITKLSVPVAILTNNMTASSGEAVLVSFAGRDHTRTFGSDTAGYASANTAFEMPDGAQVRITTLQFRDNSGHVYDEAPIAPDVVTDTPDKDALHWLAEEQACS